MVVTSSAFAGKLRRDKSSFDTSASSVCGAGSAECGISGIAAGTELGLRLGFDDSFVRTTRADGEAVEGWWFFVAGWRSAFESRVDDLIIIFSNSIKGAGRPLNGGDLEGPGK